MPIPQIYYLDAASLGAATSIYMDDQLTNCAPDGFYSDGIITRELVDCVLLPEQICETCGLSCDLIVEDIVEGNGIYRFNIDAGASTGAILIYLTVTNGAPNGILTLFDSNAYNKLSSSFDGYHQSTNPIGYTFVGDISEDCGITGTTYPLLTNFIFNGTGFTNTPTTSVLTVSAGDVSLSSMDPATLLMVIPKPNSLASIITIYAAAVCDDALNFIEIKCPEMLPEFKSTEVTDVETACSLEYAYIYYFASVGMLLNINIYDYVFIDAYGQYPLPDGFYGLIDSFGATVQRIEVQNGIVISINSC